MSKDSNSTFNSTTTYKPPLIKDNTSILKIKVFLAAWLVFKFEFLYSTKLHTIKKKKINKKISVCHIEGYYFI